MLIMVRQLLFFRLHAKTNCGNKSCGPIAAKRDRAHDLFRPHTYAPFWGLGSCFVVGHAVETFHATYAQRTYRT